RLVGRWILVAIGLIFHGVAVFGCFNAADCSAVSEENRTVRGLRGNLLTRLRIADAGDAVQVISGEVRMSVRHSRSWFCVCLGRWPILRGRRGNQHYAQNSEHCYCRHATTDKTS